VDGVRAKSAVVQGWAVSMWTPVTPVIATVTLPMNWLVVAGFVMEKSTSCGVLSGVKPEILPTCAIVTETVVPALADPMPPPVVVQ